MKIKYYYQSGPEGGTLWVWIYHANNLSLTNSGQLPNPLVKVSLQSSLKSGSRDLADKQTERKTSIKQQTQNPSFVESVGVRNIL